jgi:8-oxo-dGTP pyrophosphatase MutT (NUDIX family)
MHAVIRSELEAIEPFDAIERDHLSDALAWIDSGAELFRLARPATPPRHLVSYFAVVDGSHILLVDHKNAQLWLPAGGHVEPLEHPRATVERELREELGLTVSHPIGPPALVSCTTTVGLTAGHTDVSLWYVLCASREQPVQFDTGEFNSVRWFPFDAIPRERVEPHLSRFIAKVGSNPSLHPNRYGAPSAASAQG